MKHYRIRLDVHVEARHLEQARRRASCLYSDLERRPWVVEILTSGIEERLPLEQEGERA